MSSIQSPAQSIADGFARDVLIEFRLVHISNMDTLIHLLKGSLGTGILAMPNAFHHSGWVVGSIGTIVIGFICTYCIHLLIKAEYELCKRKQVIVRSVERACRAGPQLWAAVANCLASARISDENSYD